MCRSCDVWHRLGTFEVKLWLDGLEPAWLLASSGASHPARRQQEPQCSASPQKQVPRATPQLRYTVGSCTTAQPGGGNPCKAGKPPRALLCSTLNTSRHV